MSEEEKEEKEEIKIQDHLDLLEYNRQVAADNLINELFFNE